MPKRVYDGFYRALYRDIVTNYKIGEKYLGVREIATKFNVSLQIAQKGVTELTQTGLLQAAPKRGIFIASTTSAIGNLSSKKITIISNKQDGHFYSAFFEGVQEAGMPFGITTYFLLNTYPKTNSLGFGEYLTSLETDGLVMLSFPDSALPFYHVMREGVDIVSDIILDTLPILPARQTWNYKHAYDAGKQLIQDGCTHFYQFGYYPKNNKRFKGFQDAIRENHMEAYYVELSSMNGVSSTSEILRNITDDTGLFISDYSAAYFVDSICSREKTKPKHILVYDTDEDYFHAQYLPPIKAVAPSLKQLGQSLAHVLIQKWQKGSYPLPLQLKI